MIFWKEGLPTNIYLVRRIIRLTLAVISVIYVIFFGRKKPSDTFAWCLIFLLNPYVGIVLYLIFGSTLPTRLAEKRRRKRLSDRGVNALSERFLSQPLDVSSGELTPTGEEVAMFCFSYCHAPVSRYETEQVYSTGREHYDQLFADIRQAERCIHVLFYEVENDALSRKFIGLLAEKAAEGLEVRLMVDSLTGFPYFDHMARPLRKAGGQVKRQRPFLTHYRNHRKIVVIDNKIAYIGGMNIGKRFQNEDTVKTPWRDTQVRLTGASASDLELYFLADWFVTIPKKWLPDAEKTADDYFLHRQTAGEHPCQFVTGGPTSSRESIKMTYLTLIRSARRSIRIQSPYFIPDDAILDALRSAAASGVNVEIMVPGIRSSFFLEPVTTYYCGQMLEAGATVYRYQGYLHAKTLTIDGEVCAIGSANMDRRSLFLDDEITGLFYDPLFVHRYEETYQSDVSSCDRYTLDQFRTRSNRERTAESFYRLFEFLL